MPPPPTNLLDVTLPLDSQAANLIGQDLRNSALNFQQRMSFISGTLAQRWNPGADIQPTNWTGLLFFATDTNQLFQWSGSAWVQITFGPAQTALVNPAPGPYTIPANTLVVGSVLDCFLQGGINGGTSGSAQFSLSVGGTTVISTAVNSANLGLVKVVEDKLICASIGVGGVLVSNALQVGITVNTTAGISVLGVPVTTGTGVVLFGPLKVLTYL